MASGADVRPLTAADREALSSFRCRFAPHPWTIPIEEMVTQLLPDVLDHVNGLGLWDGHQLVGVAAWSVTDRSAGSARAALLAVRTGARRLGHGRRLKLALLDHARTAGCSTMTSLVHVDNEAMIRLNAELGGWFSPIPGDPDHLECTIDLGVSSG